MPFIQEEAANDSPQDTERKLATDGSRMNTDECLFGCHDVSVLVDLCGRIGCPLDFPGRIQIVEIWVPSVMVLHD
jgi:hypothetical protein